MAIDYLSDQGDLSDLYRQQISDRETEATLGEFETRMRAAEAENAPSPPAPVMKRDPSGYPYMEAPPGADLDAVKATAGEVPVYTGNADQDRVTSEQSTAAKIFNRLLGIDPTLPPEEALRRARAGEPFAERYQLWPERMVRSAATLAGDVFSGREQATPGLRREDVTDIPGTAQPGDRLVERAQDLAGAAVLGGMPMTPRGALGTSGSRAPAPHPMETPFPFERVAAPDNGMRTATDEMVVSVRDALATAGRLNEDGTVTLYHVTTSDRVPSINEAGLIPGKEPASGQSWKAEHSDTATYFFGNRDAAQMNVDQMVEMGGDAKLIEVRVPVTKETLARILPDEDVSMNPADGVKALVDGESVAILGGVPRANIDNAGMPPVAAAPTAMPAAAPTAMVRTVDEAVAAIANKLGKTPEEVRDNWSYANQNDYFQLAENQGIPVAPPAQPFYSALARAVEAAPIEQAPAKDWVGFLQNRPGVKKEELDWLGVADWLKEQPGPVSKADVANFVRENQVEVRTVKKSNEVSDSIDEDAMFEKAHEIFGEWEGAPPSIADNLEMRQQANGLVTIETPDGIVVNIANAGDEMRVLSQTKDRLRQAIEAGDEGELLRDLATEAADLTLRTRGANRGGLDALRAEIPEDFQTVKEAGLEPTVHPEDPSIMAFFDQDGGDIVDVGDLRSMQRAGRPISPEVLAAAERIESRYEAAGVGATKYGSYQLAGGKNYREILLTLPEGKPTAADIIRRDGSLNAANKGDVARTYISAHWDEPNVLAHARVNDRNFPVARSPEDAAALAARDAGEAKIDAIRQQQDEVARQIQDMRATFEAARAKRIREDMRAGRLSTVEANRALEATEPVPGMQPLQERLAELRAQEDAIRKDLPEAPEMGAKRTLFVEEIQSDWHQQGRRAGYQTKNQQPPSLEEMMADQGWKSIADNGEVIFRDNSSVRYENRAQAEEALRNSYFDDYPTTNNGRVPDAPFKTSWPELTLKRLIKMAADEGYDQIAWTNGRMQAERYDLSKQVDHIDYRKVFHNFQPDGGYELGVVGKNGERVRLPKEVFTPDELPDVVGKDIADKIIRGEGRPGGNRMTLDNLDLQVGGEGMVGFYDNILVKAANKLGKKFGAKVEDVKLPDDQFEVVRLNVRGREGRRGGVEYRVRDLTKGEKSYVGGQFETEQAALEWINANDTRGPKAMVHTLQITPQMASAARNEGFALFQAGLPLPGGESQDDFARRMGGGAGAGAAPGWTPPPPTDAAWPPVPESVKQVTPSYMEKAVSTTGAVVKDIAKGVFREAPRATVRGVLRAADNSAGALNELGDWLDRNVVDLSFDVPSSGNAVLDTVGSAVLNPVDAIKRSLHGLVEWVPEPESTTGKMVQATAQFLAGYIPALRAARAAGLGTIAAPTAAAAGSGFMTTDPNEGNLSNFIQSFPMLANPVSQFMATDPNDPDGVNRLRNAVEQAGFGLITEGVVRAIRFAASSRATTKATAALQEADTAAGKIIGDNLDRMGGAADQPLVVVKGKSPRPMGPSVPAGDNVPGRAAQALGRSAQETVLGVPDHVAAAGVTKDAQTGLLQLVDVGDDGAAAAVKAGRKGVYINLGRIDTADDVKAMIQQVADAMEPEVTLAKRGVQSLDDTARLANRLGMTAEELIARPKGMAYNAEQIVAANRILTTSAENLWSLAEKAAAPTATIVDGYNFRRALTVHNAVQQAVLGANAEAGRALSALRIARSSSGSAMNRELTAIMDQLGGQSVAQDMAQRMLELRAAGVAEGAIDAAVRRGWLATTQAMVRESYALGQLWNPKTHLRNLTSNTVVSFQQSYERYAAGKIGQLLATPVDEAIPPTEAIAYMHGQIGSLKDAFRLASRTAMTGDTTGLLGKVDIPQEAIASSTISRELGHSAAEAAKFAESPMGRAVDFIGTATRVPGRALATGDQFFKTIAYSGEIRAQALRKATQEGLTGKALADRVADLVSSPPEWLHQAAVDHALYATFNNQPGEIAQALLRVRNYDGVVNPTFMMAPYLRTPANILRYTANRTPLALMSRIWWDDIAAGGARRDLALARMATGTAVIAVAMDYASSGIVTGAGPSSAAEKEVLRGTGWQPYSVKIGDKYYSYQGLDPMTTPFAFAAGVAEMVKASDLSPEDFDAVEELIGQAAGVVATNIVDKSYFQGIAGFVGAIEDAGRGREGAFAAYMTRQTSGLVPLASVGRMANDIMDPTRREPANMMEGVMSQIPGLRERLIPARTVWGEPVKPQEVYGRFYDIASPIYVSRETGSAVDNELVRLNSGVQRIPWKASFAGVQVNFHDFPKVLDEYRRLAGNELKHPAWQLGAKDYLDEVVSGRHSMSQVYEILSDGPDGGKAAFIKNTVSEYRKLAQDQILADAQTRYPSFYEYVTGKQAKAQELKMPIEAAPAAAQ